MFTGALTLLADMHSRQQHGQVGYASSTGSLDNFNLRLDENLKRLFMRLDKRVAEQFGLLRRGAGGGGEAWPGGRRRLQTCLDPLRVRSRPEMSFVYVCSGPAAAGDDCSPAAECCTRIGIFSLSTSPLALLYAANARSRTGYTALEPAVARIFFAEGAG